MNPVQFFIITVAYFLGTAVLEKVHIDKVLAFEDNIEEVYLITEYVTVTTDVTIQQLQFESTTITTDVTLTTENIVMVTETATSTAIDTVTSTLFSLYTMEVVETETLTITTFINTDMAKGDYVQIQYEYVQ